MPTVGLLGHLIVGGVVAAMSSGFVSAQTPMMEIILPLYQFPYSSYQVEAPMWEQLLAATNTGTPITAILNPLSGPNVVGDGLVLYKTILNTYLNLGDERAEPSADDNDSLTMICYVSTAYGVRPEAEVKADVDLYETNFPGVCDGIFFDEASSDITDDDGKMTATGDLYESYNNYVVEKEFTDSEDEDRSWTVTFNPGGGVDPAYFAFSGNPTVMSYENFYRVMKNVGMPRPPSSVLEPSQHALAVHTTSPDLDGNTEETRELVEAIVHAAACSGWGKIYLTSDSQDPGSADEGNPWDVLTNYWDTLVDAVKSYLTLPPPSCSDPEMALMVPLWLAGEALDDALDDVLSVVTKSNFLEGGVMVVLDARDGDGTNQIATELRNAGARVLCYFDFNSYDSVYSLIEELTAFFVTDVCGGLYVDNYSELTCCAEDNIYDLYKTVQYMIPGGMLVIDYKDTDVQLFDLYAKDWTEVSFQEGRVVVATRVEATTPFAVPDLNNDNATPQNSALVVTGFTETIAEEQEVECLLAEMKETFGYGFVTGVLDPPAETETATVTVYLDRLHSELDDPTVTVESCDAPELVTSACGSVGAAELQWLSASREIRVRNGGCADMARIFAQLVLEGVAGEGITTGSPLREVEPGVWQLDATIDVQAGSVLKIVGEDGLGECNELRLLTDSTDDRRTRVLGNRGDVVIQNTKIVGWKSDVNMPDTADSNDRGYILCSSCPGTSTDQCVMSVTDSELSYLGGGGTSTGGLAWKDLCGSSATATARGLTITGNRRGIYAFGAVLDFDDLDITGSVNEGVRVDSCSGYVKGSTIDQEDSSAWAIFVQRPNGTEISGNQITGSKSLILRDDLEGGHSPTVNGNTILTPTLTSVRVRTANTDYKENSGDEKCEGCSRIGLRALSTGCFTQDSVSNESEVNAYIAIQTCAL